MKVHITSVKRPSNLKLLTVDTPRPFADFLNMQQAPSPTELQTITKDIRAQIVTSPEAVKSQDVTFNLLDEFERLRSDDSRVYALNEQNTILQGQVNHLGSQLNWMSARHTAEKDKLLEENAALADTILRLRREIEALKESDSSRQFYNDYQSGQRLLTPPAEATSRSRERLGFFGRKLEYIQPGLRRRSSQIVLATSNDHLRQHGSTITTSDHLRQHGSVIATSDQHVHHGLSVIASDRFHHQSSSVLTDDILSHHGSSVLIGAKAPKPWPATSDMLLGR